MIKDINLFINDSNSREEYKTRFGEGTINIVYNATLKSKLRIVYDENIYELCDYQQYEIALDEPGALEILVEENQNITLRFKINEKYLVKTIYKFENKFINKEELIKELDFFKTLNMNSADISELINVISNLNEQTEIENALVNNKTYVEIAKKMSAKDLMLLITNYIFVPKIPKISQEFFDDLVKEATTSNHALEDTWRLAMNYDKKGYNFDLIDEYFVNAEDVWYLSEYISGVDQVDSEKIVNMLITKNNKDFIKEFLKDNFVEIHLGEELINKLKEHIGLN